MDLASCAPGCPRPEQGDASATEVGSLCASSAPLRRAPQGGLHCARIAALFHSIFPQAGEKGCGKKSKETAIGLQRFCASLQPL
jgi:hypothetical protein